MADEPKPPAKTAASAKRSPRPRKSAADETPTAVSGPAVRTLSRPEREALRARLQKRFH